MAALIRQANSWYEMANKPKIKIKKRMYGGKKKQQPFLKRKMRQEMAVSNVTKAGYT